jgi:mycothiol system anti-sigma-R factor
MNCEDSFEKLYQFIDKDLDGLTCSEVEKHLKDCRPCWNRYEFERLLKMRLQSSCRQEPMSETLLLRIKTLLEKY